MSIANSTEYCSLCHRKLDVESDPLSADCGGDCAGCIAEYEDEWDGNDDDVDPEDRPWLI